MEDRESPGKSIGVSVSVFVCECVCLCLCLCVYLRGLPKAVDLHI